MRPNNTTLTYSPFERLAVSRPVHRIDHLAGLVKGLRVLDLGAFDESVDEKFDENFDENFVKRKSTPGWRWLHEVLATSAASVLGIDSSRKLESRGELKTGPASRILHGTVTSRRQEILEFDPEIVIAGELIEHIASPLEWLRELAALCPGRRIVITTPNATSMVNIALAFANRENCDPHHIAVYSFKTLAKVSHCARFSDASITPYFYDTQLLGFRFPGIPRAFFRILDVFCLRPIQYVFPLTAFGLVLDGRLANRRETGEL